MPQPLLSGIEFSSRELAAIKIAVEVEIATRVGAQFTQTSGDTLVPDLRSALGKLKTEIHYRQAVQN